MRTKAEVATGFAVGALSMNSLPHLITAVAGKRMMTPLGGADSSATTNLVWGAMNLVGGLLLARFPRTGTRGWQSRTLGFTAGCLVFAAWDAIYETVSRRRSGR